MNAMQIKFTNGWFAEYAGDGKWIVVDSQGNDGVVRGCSYLDSLMAKFNLVRLEAK